MLYPEYDVLGVKSSSWHGEIERDDITLCSAMRVELWTRKSEMGGSRDQPSLGIHCECVIE